MKSRIPTLLLALAALTLCSCAPKVSPKVVMYIPPKPVAWTTSPAAMLGGAAKDHTAADQRAAGTAVKVQKTKTDADALVGQLTGLSAQVNTLSALPVVPGASLTAVYTNLVEREKDAALLSTALADVTTSLDEERALRKAGAEQLALATQQAATKDTEADSLRIQLEQSISANSDIVSAGNVNAEAAIESGKRVEKLQGEVNTWRWICGATAVAFVGLMMLSLVLRNASRTINPLG